MALLHTATPWIAGTNCITQKSTGRPIAIAPGLEVGQAIQPHAQILEDMDFIVRAANTHDELVAELTHAHYIILAMLVNMTSAGKRKADAALTAAGHSPAGMTRFHERMAVLAKASAA